MLPVLNELGIKLYFYYPTGINNAITDVSGVRVGHSSIISGTDVRTGVTVVIPPIDFKSDKLIAGGYAFNANGEVTGLSYILEEARLISPVFLTNTFSVGNIYKAVIDYYGGVIALPVIGECWDGFLNDIVGRHIKQRHVIEAIESASDGPVEQGAVGAGVGMTAFGYKSGIGTSSRQIMINDHKYTIGVLLNNNLGNETGRHKYLRIGSLHIDDSISKPGLTTENIDQSDSQASSAIIVIATDLPLDHHQLNRISKRAFLGMGRIGAVSYSDSGEFAVSFSTANKVPRRGSRKNWQINVIEESLLDPVFEATVEAVEEAFINSMLNARDMTGIHGHFVKALNLRELVQRKK